MNKYLIFACCFLLNVGLLNAQSTVLNNNRTGLKWQQIKTEDFKVIFPEGFDSEAQRVANTLQSIHDPIDESLGTNTRRATIVFQNRNSSSNGFVTLGPRRSEFYTSAPQDYNFLGTNDWLNILAVHEYRHLAQFNKSRTGFNKLFYYLFGQNTQGAMANIAAPPWFWEGDATVTETAFTRSGRGRIPAFNRIYRANLLEGKRFNYHKQSLRSYKDFVPNHYVLGYHMISHIRKDTDNKDIFADVTKRTWDVPFIPFAFSNALHNKTGKYVVEHYENMMDELSDEWSAQLKNTKLSSYETITRRNNNTFADYSCPIPMKNGKWFAMKSGIGDIAQFVMISVDGSEEKLFTPGILNNSGMFSVAGNTAAWVEYTYDPRWRNQSYSVIKLYNQDTESLKVLTKRSRYHGVSLSPNTRQVATIESLENGTYRLVILDANSGSVLKQFNNQTQGLLTLPVWSSDGKKITFLSNKSGKKSVQVIEVASGEESFLIPASNENIGNPSLVNQYLFYQSGYTGIDNIYALDTKDGKKYQVTSSKYGAYNISVSNDQKSAFYNDHTVNGLDIVSIIFDPSKWTPIDIVTSNDTGYYKFLEEQEQQSDILDDVSEESYQVKKHSRLKGLINPHSWGPFINTNNLNEAQVGVFSQDVLSTTSIYAGYNYNVDTKDGALVGRVSYQGFYPILDFEFTKGGRTDDLISWDEQTIEGGVRLPFLLTRSKYHSELTIGNSIGLREVTNYQNGVDNLGRAFSFETTTNDGTPVLVEGEVVSELDNGQLTFNHFTASYFRLLKQSTRDINSKYGQSLVFEKFDALDGDYVGSLTALRGALYFPGLIKHHSFYVRGSYQTREITDENNLYAFANRVFRPRGYDSYPTEKKSTLFRLNYSLPLLYPDLSLGPILNIKRIKANLFSDFGSSDELNYFTVSRIDDASVNEIQGLTRDVKYKSYGVELTFDFNVMRFPSELELGVRYVYTTANEIFPQADSKFQLIIGNISF